MPSRRDVLAAGGTLALAGLAGCVDQSFAGASTQQGTWPSARHDARNTGRAPDATPPTSDPSVLWERSFGAADNPEEVVVAHDTVYAARASGVSALDPETGETRWETDDSGQTPAEGVPRTAAAAGDTLYTADKTGVRAFDTDGTLRWTAATPRVRDGDDIRQYGLLPYDGGVLWGTHGRLSDFGTDGTHRWTYDAEGSDATYPALADGSLYAGTPGPLLSASRPGAVGRLTGGGPSVSWRADAPGRPTWPLVTDDRILLGDRGFTGSDHTVHAFTRDGTDDWRISVSGPTSHLALTDDDTAVVVAGGDESEGVVTGVDVASGERVWTREDAEITDTTGSLAVAGDTCLVAGFAQSSASPVRALDAMTGESRWTAAVSGDVTTLVAVEDRVFVGTRLGHLVALA
jgi:hypothetical protein